MSVIYTPRGRAKEYAALACNIYDGCTYGCKYCFVSHMPLARNGKWSNTSGWPRPKPNFLAQLEKDADKLAKKGCKEEILLSFTGDVYHSGDTSMTREALDIIGKAGLNATVLTKGGFRAIRDFDLLRQHKFRFGSTVCWKDDALRKQWEPGAATVEERAETIRYARSQGIFTWVSLEPVIDPAEALKVIESLHPHVDYWKVGKLNHLDSNGVDWGQFLADVTGLLRSVGAHFYIKNDLAAYGKRTEKDAA